ncbi:Uncharacterised protein [uncultured archaeon]|nr:Uncharacterised protein [uncultured archaeon]
MMENQRSENAECIKKAPYVPPKAVFVPLKLEERLMKCDVKSYGLGCGLLFSCGSCEVEVT